MLTKLRRPFESRNNIPSATKYAASDKAALAFFVLAMSYLLLGVLFGTIGGFQYILPDFLKDALAFQKTRPLHVYLVIAWIFTAAQAGVYYYLPRIKRHKLYWPQGAWAHFFLQAGTSLLIIISFFAGKFSGREYLEFPPALGLLIAAAWIPFAVNFFGTLKPDYRNAPVYYFSWTTGIVFFFITFTESYLWLFDHFFGNPIRDTTVQWKALGSMVGSWNMLIYGTSLYLMERIKGDKNISRNNTAFFFYFLGFTNLLFNWGHHTYIVPAAPWIKNVAYIISMTELLILGQIIWNFRKTLSDARKNFHYLPFRFLSLADGWIFINLVLAIAISVPALNFFTHGTHITVAHAMGATIGINTMLLFASLFYVLEQKRPEGLRKNRRWITTGATVTNLSLLVFWFSLVGSGAVKIAGQLRNEAFAQIMKTSEALFRVFTFSGVVILLGLALVITGALRTLLHKEETGTETEISQTASKLHRIQAKPGR